MQKQLHNYAYIDGQNLYMGIKTLGWELDWMKFRRYLKEKYEVEVAYIFLGYIEKNQQLYRSLQKKGYRLIFKDVIRYGEGNIKGKLKKVIVPNLKNCSVLLTRVAAEEYFDSMDYLMRKLSYMKSTQ